MGPDEDFTIIGLGASELDDYTRDAADEQGRTIKPDSEPEKGFYYRSDHFNFAKVGVPALNPDSGRRVRRQACLVTAARSATSGRRRTTTSPPIT